MSKSPAQDIAEYLAGLSYSSLVLSDNLFVCFEKTLGTTQTYSVSIFDSSSFSAESGYSYERPNIQIRVRAVSYDIAYAICKQIRDLLHDKTDLITDEYRYIAIWTQTEPILESYDESRRPCVSCNLRIHRTLLSA